MQNVIDALPDHIVIIDENGYIVFKNKAWTFFTIENGGSIPTTDIGVNYLDVLKKSNNTAELNGILQVKNRTIDEFSMEYACHSQTQERWFCLYVNNLSDHQIMIRHENITQLICQKSTVEDVLESMTDAFFTLNENWEFSFVNTAGYHLLGRAVGTLVNKNIWLEFPEAIHDISYKKYHTTMNDSETSIFETFYPPLNTWFEARAYPQKNGGISVYFRDIGERKKIEEWDSGKLVQRLV
jgi:PAS domain-containing protein